MSKHNEGQRNASFATSSTDNNVSGSKLCWTELNLERLRSGVLMSAPAPHLKHSASKAGTDVSRCSRDGMNTSQDVNSGDLQHPVGMVLNSDSSRTIKDTAIVEEPAACERPSSNELEQMEPQRGALTSFNSGMNGLPEWAQSLKNILGMRTNSGGPIRKAIIKAIEHNPPAQAREKLRQAISKGAFKSNNASRTKKLALDVLQDAENGIFRNDENFEIG